MEEMAVFEALVNWLASYFDIEVVLLVLIISRVCNLLGRLIPDDKTGWLGYLRTVLKIAGLYARNRSVSKGA